jgi:nucleobase transporter 1/2
VGSLIVSVSDCTRLCLQGDLSRVVQSALFVSAINTLVQTILGSRLPAVMGNSFYFLPITLSIVNAPAIVEIEDSHEVGG